jgi:hypothetical protein
VELNRTTPPELAEVLAELQAREPIFHRPEWGTSRADFEAMTELGFWETGASGRRYSRDVVLQELARRYQGAGTADDDVWETSDFYCQQLASDLYLLTYTLRQSDRLTRRSTLWRRVYGTWKIVYHQGTVAE